MLRITPGGKIFDSSLRPITRNSKYVKAILTASGQPTNQAGELNIYAQEVYNTTATVTWSMPVIADSFEVDISTDQTFQTATTRISNGLKQIKALTGLLPDTEYHVRARSLAAGVDPSAWVYYKFHTYFTAAGNARIATNADLNLAWDPEQFIEVGDYIIDGSNGGPGNGKFGAGFAATVPALAAGKKVVVRGWIGLDYFYLNMSNNVGTAQTPYYITNVGGVVNAKPEIESPKHTMWTGEYDASKKLGWVGAKGFNEENWAILHQKFGFMCRGEYDDTQAINCHIIGQVENFTIRGIECGMGSYSGMTIKNDSQANQMLNIILERCYMHDSPHGECGYFGSTQTDPQMQFVGFTMRDCIFARSGLNGFQLGQMLQNCLIENCVVINAGFSWMDAFMKYQDQATQLQCRVVGFTMREMMVFGCGGDNFLNFFMDPYVDYPVAVSDACFIDNNCFLQLRSSYGAYIQAKNAMKGTLNITNNWWGQFNTGNYNDLYTNAAAWDRVVTIEAINGNEQMVVNVGGNKYDSSTNTGGAFAVRSGQIAGITLNDAGTNTRSGSLHPSPHFNNYMDLPYNYPLSTMEVWTHAIAPGFNQFNLDNTVLSALGGNAKSTTSISIPTAGQQRTLVVGREWDNVPGPLNYTAGMTLVIKQEANSNFDLWVGTVVSYNSTDGTLVLDCVKSQGTGTFANWRISMPRVYALDQIVFFRGRFYKSLINNNLSNKPSPEGDANWELIVFSNGSLYPPDDVRLYNNDQYALAGVGLTMQVPPPVQAPKMKTSARGVKVEYDPSLDEPKRSATWKKEVEHKYRAFMHHDYNIEDVPKKKRSKK